MKYNIWFSELIGLSVESKTTAIVGYNDLNLDLNGIF